MKTDKSSSSAVVPPPGGAVSSPAALAPGTLPSVSWPGRLLAWAAGAAISVLILFALHLAHRTNVVEPLVETYEIRAVALPPPPPPPEVVTDRPPPEPVELVPVPTDSPVRLEMTINPLPVPRMPAPPVVKLQAADFRPQARLQELDFDRLFLAAEVDRIPVAVYRTVPRVSASYLARLQNRRVHLTFVVNTRGEVENITVAQAETADYGERVAEAVADWQFEPAVKAGRRVRCFVLQSVTVQLPGSNTNPFEVGR